MSEDQGISKFRAEIDRIDMELLKLVNQRAQCAIGIGEIKKLEGLPVYVPEREKQVIEKMIENNKGPLPDTAISELFHWLFDQMKKLEH